MSGRRWWCPRRILRGLRSLRICKFPEGKPPSSEHRNRVFILTDGSRTKDPKEGSYEKGDFGSIFVGHLGCFSF